jgi:hypothetical protein
MSLYYFIYAPSINSFKNRLDKHWKDEEELYYANHKADISGSRVTYREIEEIQESGGVKLIVILLHIIAYFSINIR